MKKIKTLAFATIIIIFCTACSNLIRVCVENPKRIEEAKNYTDQIPITIEELKTMIQSDTSHYKIVVIYSICCNPCMDAFKHTYSHLWKNSDTSQIRWYLLQEDCGGVKWNAKTMQQFGIYDKMYYIRDDNEQFAHDNEYKMNNLANLITSNNPNFDDIFGEPTSLVIDKKNNVKIRKIKYKGNKFRTASIDLRSYLYSDTIPKIQTLQILKNINFSTIDTTYQADVDPYIPETQNSMCTSKSCK